MAPSGWLPPDTVSGPPRKLAPRPVSATPCSLKPIVPSVACISGKSGSSAISLPCNCKAPFTPDSCRRVNGSRNDSARLALPVALVSSVKWPIQASTGLFSMYFKNSCSAPLAAPSISSCMSCDARSGTTALTLASATLPVVAVAALISMRVRSNTMVPSMCSASGHSGAGLMSPLPSA